MHICLILIHTFIHVQTAGGDEGFKKSIQLPGGLYILSI